MKKTYDKISKQRFMKSQSNDLKNNELQSSELRMSDEISNLKMARAKNNLIKLKNLDDETLEKLRLEDLFLTTRNERNLKQEHDEISVPLTYSLSQNYPNPFNPTTSISFEIPKDGIVTLIIYDITGREITKLVNEFKQIGNYTVKFDGVNYASGVYFYKLTSGDFVDTKRMVLIK